MRFVLMRYARHVIAFLGNPSRASNNRDRHQQFWTSSQFQNASVRMTRAEARLLFGMHLCRCIGWAQAATPWMERSSERKQVSQG